MAVLNPAALWFLLLLAALLLLPRLRIPRPPRFVSNLYLWQATETAAVPLLFRVRRHARILVDAAILLLIVAALARPVVTAEGRYLAVVIDVSASMGARSGTDTRLDLARRRASEAIERLPGGSRVRLISAGIAVVDHGEWTAADRQLTAAIGKLVPADGGIGLDEAIATARAASPKGAEVLVVTDLPPKDGQEGVTWIEVGGTADNVAITALAVRRLPSSPLDAQLLVEVRSFSSAEVDVPLVVQHDDAPIADERLRLAPGATRTIVLDAARPHGTYKASIQTGDALAADDERTATTGRERRIRVTLATEGSFFLERALASHPSIDLSVVRASAPLSIPADVVVCDGCAAAPADARAVLLVAPARRSGPAAPLTIAQEHPVSASLDASSIQANPVQAVAPADGDVVLRAGGQPAVIARARAGRRLVVFQIDVRDSSFPLSVAFPVLVANTIDWLARSEDDEVPSSTRWLPGESDLRKPATPAPAQESPAIVESAAVEGRIEMTAWLLAAAALLLIADGFVNGRAASRMGHLRVAAIVAVALAIAGVRVPGGNSEVAVAFVLDRSGSVAAREQSAAVNRAAELSARMQRGDRSALVLFGAEPLVELGAQERPLPPRVASRVGDSASDIGAALRVARAVLPRSGSRRVTLFSDGRDTHGAALREAAIAAADGIAIDVAAPATFEGGRVRPERVVAPDHVAAGEPFQVAVELSGPPASRGTLVITRDDDRIAEQPVTLDAEGYARVAIEQRAGSPGHATYVASVLQRGELPENAPSAGAVVTASGRPALLHVGADRRALASVLRGAGFAVRHLSPGAVPASAAALDAYDGVILEDVSAESLTGAQAAAIAEHVERSGGGLLVLGAPDTLNPAGYPRTPLGEALPIDLRRQNGTRASDLALVLVFDKSGSMADLAGDVSKIELARRAVSAVVELLPAGDALGVIAFDTTAVDVAPLAAGHDPSIVERDLRAVRASGGTAIAPAVERARAWLRASSAARKQILLVSDGRSGESDAAKLLALARTPGIEVSVVATGNDADRDFFRALASAGGGRVYFPDDMRRLPDIVAREAARSSGAWHVREPFTPRAPAAHPVLGGIDRAAIPPLDGYVAGAARTTSEIILQSHLGDAVLAGWRYGLGRVAVFTGEPSRAFAAWPDSARLWTQAARWLVRGRDAGLLHPSLVTRGDEVRLAVEARGPGATYANGLAGTASVRGPDGGQQRVPLVQVAPGRYEGAFRPTTSGTYLAAIALADGEGHELQAQRAVYWSAAREQRGRPPDYALLERIAAITGGRVLQAADNPFTAPRAAANVALRPYLVLLALLLFACEVAARKGLTASFVSSVWRARRSRTPESVPA